MMFVAKSWSPLDCVRFNSWNILFKYFTLDEDLQLPVQYHAVNLGRTVIPLRLKIGYEI
jgi:hypothetical protein